MYDSPDPSKRKIIEWVCSETGKCFTVNEALAGSTPVKRKNRLKEDKSLSELLLNEKIGGNDRDDSEQ